nr:immunoglobulin light chain junction region [Macaca mulatta]MOX09497.1 immunoglobulin light chain junction region [Macaca mulatta]MOX09518.1 immunoglobulin light chain junction region [Macaca mulatta]MOX10972.1 immunoglobulin light chain junction region [Macaca mulatta]MOX11006.1 immunoglobulin light chain junction region [Macaca mulatta]
CQQGNTDPPTF